MILLGYKSAIIRSFFWALMLQCCIGYNLNAQVVKKNSITLDISKVDSVQNLFSNCAFYIDYPPFQLVEQLPLDSFRYLTNTKLQEIWREGINTRYWFTFAITNTNERVISDRQLYFGNASRVFLYKVDGKQITLIEKKGSNYTQGRSNDGISDRMFNIEILPKDTTIYLVHVSSTFIPNGHEFIDPKIIKKGYESVIGVDVLNVQRIGMAYVAALSIILLLLIFSVIVFILSPERLVAAFGLLCISFLLYYTRDMDYFLWAVDIYPSSDEIITRTEPLFRSLINGGFLFFTFSYFKDFSFRKFFKVSSIFVFSFGVLSGVWFLLFNRISPTQEFTSLDTSLYVGYLILTQLNDLFLLIFLWKSRKDYSRFYVLGTALYLILNYGGLFKGALFPEILNIPYFDHYCFLFGAVLFTMSMGFLLIRRAQSKEVELIIQQNKSAQLEELSRMKSQFYTNVGHELKTPLSLIKAPIELQLKEKTNTSIGKRRLMMVLRNTERLISLVNDLTDYTRAENHADVLSINKKDASSHFALMLSNFESLASSENKTLQQNIQFSNQESWYDPNTIEAIVNNLLSNAFKFTEEGDTIEVGVEISEKSLILTVKDSGIGIKQQDLDNIFDRFYRADYHKEIDGLGVGLAFVKEMINRHKGNIEVSSTYGKGTLFRVEIPIYRSAYPETWIALEDADIPTLGNRTRIDMHSKELPIILIVEDNVDMREHLTHLFRDSYKVIPAQNGQEGIDCALEVVPDIILTDMMMPVMSGDQMCILLKNDEKVSHIPIIMLTANATESDKIKMLDCGVSDYILKPFNNQEILLKIRNQILLIEDLRKRFESLPIPTLVKTAVNKGEAKFWLRIETVLKNDLCDSNFTVEEFSKSMLMSRMQLHRKLKALTGLSTSGYLRSKRVEASIGLLRKGNLSISEVAYDSGFSSPSYYSKCFKDKYGVTPAEYPRSS